ncbi:MAG: GerMN domain-containing protein [Lachnospiraceae bacterium]|nr:GerMN domain-containing protein [Lachnospiraceae bacterium]
MKRKLLSVGLILLLLFNLTSCKEKNEDSGFLLYYFNNEGTGLTGISYSLTEKTATDQIGEVVEKLSEEVVDVDYHNPISEGIEVTSYDLNEGALILYFNDEYKTLTDTNEALLRAAVVKTLIQIEGVDNVTFYVGDFPLLDQNEAAIGAMTEESFLNDYGKAQSQSESEVLLLYYATSDGNNLRTVSRTAHYSTTIPLEQVVLNCLMESPDTDKLMSAIPEGTKVLSVVINEGTCYVTLDSGFLNLPEFESRDVAIYSIVNSLCELDTVSQVQIIVNNESEAGLMGTDEVSGTYSANYELVL